MSTSPGGRPTRASPTFAAVDLGASSGRVMLVSFAPDSVELTEAYRFANRAVAVGGHLHWDVLALWEGVVEGLRRAGRLAPISGIGVDSWGVDYGLLDADGNLLGEPYSYRDNRAGPMRELAEQKVSATDAYAATGTFPLAINTVFQWLAARDTTAMRHAGTALLIPDLVTYWLTGSLGTETTNASTTGLLDAGTRDWCDEVITRLGLRHDLFAPLREPGTPCGTLTAEVRAATGLGDVPVYAVGSHDTASAVVGVPETTGGVAYVSSGTWSLVGVETARPIRTEAARAARFSNELGVDGTVRFLTNVIGLWPLQECLREWADGDGADDGAVAGSHDADGLLSGLLDEAAGLPARRSLVDLGGEEFLAPDDMPARIARACERAGQPVPQTRAETVRCILDSLAAAYAKALTAARELSGVEPDVVHVVGGGSRNALLCRLTADACGIPVVAGPVEATALGNALVQARAAGVLTGGLPALRVRILGHGTTTFEPTPR